VASGGSYLQLSDNSYAEDDADRIRAVCVAPSVWPYLRQRQVYQVA